MQLCRLCLSFLDRGSYSRTRRPCSMCSPCQATSFGPTFRTPSGWMPKGYCATLLHTYSSKGVTTIFDTYNDLVTQYSWGNKPTITTGGGPFCRSKKSGKIGNMWDPAKRWVPRRKVQVLSGGMVFFPRSNWIMLFSFL